MKRSKATVLRDLAKRLNLIYDYYVSVATKKRSKEDIENNSYINYLKDMYINVKNAPVWPFDLTILSKFVASIVVPLLILVPEFL